MLKCIHCSAPLFSNIEQEHGEWIMLCIICRAKNIVIPNFEIVAWRE
jgi:hypothetical protein